MDGGKDYYAVKFVGEAEARVFILNAWEAHNPEEVSDIADLMDDGKVLYSIDLIPQSEDGYSTLSYYIDDYYTQEPVEWAFDDTLLYQQADFEAGITRFTITLDDYEVGADGSIDLINGGAGHVGVDVNGDGVIEIDNISHFTNFENIRTVSGVGNAVAGDGQGIDTLDISDLSRDTSGVEYTLEGNDEDYAGEVWYYFDDGDDWEAGDFDEWYYFMQVDGVENIITGLGNDYLWIDETEAAKDNLFSASLGDDSIYYENNFNDDANWEPIVTITVNTEDDTDTVEMTGGRVGTTVATDTLESVENIFLWGYTAEGYQEADVLDVTNVHNAVVDYSIILDADGDGVADEDWDRDGYIDGWDLTDVVIGRVYEAGDIIYTPGEVQVTIESLYEIENVIADGRDAVIVGDADVMSLNERADHWDERTELQIDTYLTYDSFDPDLNRESVADMMLNNEFYNELAEVRNFGEFTFDLGQDTDRVDYSRADDQIDAIVAVDAGVNYVMVNGTGDPDGYKGDEDRVDALVGVEQIVASTGESILDFTALGQDVQVTFQYDDAGKYASLDRLESLVRIADSNGNTIDGIPTYVEYYDMDDDDEVMGFTNATWSRVEGSDFGERIYYQGSEDLLNDDWMDHRYSYDTLNLRGGENGVSYYELETSITAYISVVEYNEEDPFNTGLINAIVEFQDGTGGDLANGGDPGFGFDGASHWISSYTGDNGLAEGSLKLEASQDAEDALAFINTSDKVYILGLSPGVIDVAVGDLDAMRLTGFELLLDDGETNDVYDMRSLPLVYGSLELVDFPGVPGNNDHDIIKVYNDAADDAYNGGIPGDTTIDLAELNTLFSFDFDVLDASGVTSNKVTDLIGTTGVGPTDEVVLGEINNIDTITDFESVVFTDASIDDVGDTFTLETSVQGTYVLHAGAELIDWTTTNLNLDDPHPFSGIAVSFGGLVLEAGTFGEGQVANVTEDITFTVTGDSYETVQIWGGEGDDTLTGANGDDIIYGGLGADTLDGSFIPEVTEKVVVKLTGDGTLLEGGDVLEIAGVTISDAGTDDVTVQTDSDPDQVASAFITWAAIAANKAAIETNLGLNAGDLDSVTYDSVANNILFSFTHQAGDVADGTVTIDDTGVTTGDISGTVYENGTDPEAQSADYTVQLESEDTFVYTAAAESTQAITDTIDNFNFGTVGDDVIDLSAIDADPDNPGDDAFSGLTVDNAEYASLTALKAAAADELDFVDVFVGRTATDSYVFVDADIDGTLDATDMMIKLAGVNDLTGFDTDNISF
jgi:hypothetical protein